MQKLKFPFPTIRNLTFRFATEGDTEIILGLIKERAAYETLSHEMVADTETLFPIHACCQHGTR